MYEEDLKRMKEEYIQELLRYYREHGITKESMMNLDTMIHSIKNLCKICESCEEEKMYSGRSMNMRSYDQDYSGRPYMGMNDYSGARGRGSYANRDSMGRYSSAGYSGHHDVVEELYGVMNMTQDESTRREIQDMINRMEAKH